MKNFFLTMAVAMLFGATASAQCKVGDIYDKDGLKGIVVKVDETGEHGLIMSLKKSAKKWLSDSDEKSETAAFFEDDGEKNMAAIEKYIEENGKSWEIFPFFEWCRSLGEGWYAPATDELKDILVTINGGEGKYNAKFMKVITKTLKKAKGDGLVNGGMTGTNNPQWMLSSTETGGGMVYALQFQESTSSSISRNLVGGFGFGAKGKGTPKGDFKVSPWTKKQTGGKFAGTFGSRAVHKF